MARPDHIDDAGVAASGGSWVDDYRRLSGSDPAGLAAEELEDLADAAWMVCRLEESMATRQQAYVRYLAARDDRPAATCQPIRTYRRRNGLARLPGSRDVGYAACFKPREAVGQLSLARGCGARVSPHVDIVWIDSPCGFGSPGGVRGYPERNLLDYAHFVAGLW